MEQRKSPIADVEVSREKDSRALELVGRDAEGNRPWSFVDRATTGGGGAMLVTGAAGIGKTVLIE
jgi:Cdc6-like AAA superfamily ATPase